MAKPETRAELPITAKLTDGARAFRMTPKEFRELLDKYNIPVMRPSKRRELIQECHLRRLCEAIAGPAARYSDVQTESNHAEPVAA